VAAAIAALGMMGMVQVARAQQLVQHCRSGNACMTTNGIRSCGTVSHCWFTVHRFDAIFTEPEGIAGGIRIPRRRLDLQPDAVMDCWKDLAPNARLTSGFPFRNDGVTPHDGIDVASDSGNYGHGAPVRSVGAGVVVAVGESRPNGRFARIDQGDGVRMTYIHLRDTLKADGSALASGDRVHPGTQIGHMNCTGYCGGRPDDPWHGHISKTHVHVQGMRLPDNRLVDVEDLYGGPDCQPTGGDDGGDAGDGPGGVGGGGGACPGGICNEIP
jgi:hypothetical protein